jgi:hypothetical protein
MDTRPMVQLVDCATGIYNWHSLATRFPLYVFSDKNEGLLDAWLMNHSDSMDGVTTETVFHPDTKDFTLEYLTYGPYTLRVLNDDLEYWHVVEIEGTLWAINPLAEWNEAEDTYTF